MRIGFANNPRQEVLGEIEWIGRNGFDFVDLFLEPDRAAVEAVEPARIREALDRLHLGVVGHLAYYLPIASPLPQLRKAAVDAAREYLEVFAGIGVPAVTVHAHWPPRMFSTKEGIGWQIESLRAILDTAKALDVRLLYEPLDTEHDTPEHVETILNALPELLLHLDLGHSNLCGRNPAGMIRRFPDRLHHVHLHDNDGRSDQHLPPGAGNIDWRAVMRALREARYDRTITLEVFSRDRDYVLLAQEKVKAWWAKEMSAQ